jgi:gamma-glutamyl:cysteine ligase YbdK (ATP-grasp superfamily)
MGLDLDRDRFAEDDYRRFAERLTHGLAALAEVLARPGFGEGEPTIGAELELCLVDAAGRPVPKNLEVLADTGDPRVVAEIDRFNLEINTEPSPLAGAPFSALAAELEGALAAIRRAAAQHGASTATVGILPTLSPADLGAEALTDAHRYRALSHGLKRARRERFRVRIEGEDALDVESDDVAMEGANTSFQVHLRVPPRDFCDVYNAAQLATAPALAVAVNSPTLLGQRLWDETRIALFRQAVDDRFVLEADDWRPARVSFGHGWARGGALELFEEGVALHEPLLPVCGPEDPLACARAGGTPTLAELRTHHGTVWRWNRAIYDHHAGGHLRVEMRALPSGPTIVDMAANAAFLLGVTLALAPDARSLTSRMTFGHARRNFYCAARYGLEAELLWPSPTPPSPRPVHAADLVLRLLPVAERALVRAGVNASEAARMMEVIHQRARRGVTPAGWQRRAIASLAPRLGQAEAITEMFARYRAESATGRPVHEWSLVA